MPSMFDFNSIKNFSETNGTHESLIIKCIDYLNKFSSDVSKIFHDTKSISLNKHAFKISKFSFNYYKLMFLYILSFVKN